MKTRIGELHILCSRTLSSAISMLEYTSSEDHCMIFSFIRYCTRRRVLLQDIYPSRRSNRVTLSPPLSASCDLMVGGNCLWSPANTTLLPLSMPIQQFTSRAYAHSSTTTTLNCMLCRSLSPAPVFVQQMTVLSSNTSIVAIYSKDFFSFCISQSSLFSVLFSLKDLALSSFLSIFWISSLTALILLVLVYIYI
jgi:hypothetical protein